MPKFKITPAVSPQKQSCRIADNLTANLQTQIRQVYYHIGETENWRILLKAAGIETLEAASNATCRQKYRNSSGKLCSRHIGRYSYHSFRHTFCTIAANAGKDLAIIRSIVGHANIQMTSHYTHYSLESKRQVIESLPLPQRTIAKPPPLQELIPSLTSSQLADLGSWLERKLTSELKKELLLKMDYCLEKAN